MSDIKWYLDWRSYLAILCLLFPVPIIGLILMWFIAPWSIKTKRIIAFCYLGIPIILAITVFFYLFATSSVSNTVTKAADVKRISDISSIAIAAHNYCIEKNGCASTQLELTSPTFSSYIHYIPSDPETSNNYLYRLTENGNNCEIEATLSTGEKHILNCYLINK